MGRRTTHAQRRVREALCPTSAVVAQAQQSAACTGILRGVPKMTSSVSSPPLSGRLPSRPRLATTIHGRPRHKVCVSAAPVSPVYQGQTHALSVHCTDTYQCQLTRRKTLFIVLLFSGFNPGCCILGTFVKCDSNYLYNTKKKKIKAHRHGSLFQYVTHSFLVPTCRF